MGFLQISEGIDAKSIPAPPKRDEWNHVLTVRPWVMPIAFAAGNGIGEGSVNGIGFTDQGDLLLYREITNEDRERFPQLYGIRDVWIVFKLGEEWEEK